MMSITSLLFSLFFPSPVAALPVVKHPVITQISIYEACIKSGRSDCEELYKPIYSACRDQDVGCLPDLNKGVTSPLSFKRCRNIGLCSNQAEAGLNHQFVHMVLTAETERTELRDPYEAKYGSETLYHLRLRIPQGQKLTTTNRSIVIAQLHGVNSYSPPLALRLKSNEAGDIVGMAVTVRHHTSTDPVVQNGKEEVIHYGPFETGRWHHFTLLVRSGAIGRVRVARDGVTLADYHGPVGYLDSPSYFKFGPYDWTKTQSSEFLADYSFYWRISVVSNTPQPL